MNSCLSFCHLQAYRTISNCFLVRCEGSLPFGSMIRTSVRSTDRKSRPWLENKQRPPPPPPHRRHSLYHLLHYSGPYLRHPVRHSEPSAFLFFFFFLTLLRQSLCFSSSLFPGLTFLPHLICPSICLFRSPFFHSPNADSESLANPSRAEQDWHGGDEWSRVVQAAY